MVKQKVSTNMVYKKVKVEEYSVVLWFVFQCLFISDMSKLVPSILDRFRLQGALFTTLTIHVHLLTLTGLHGEFQTLPQQSQNYSSTSSLFFRHIVEICESIFYFLKNNKTKWRLWRFYRSNPQ